MQDEGEGDKNNQHVHLEVKFEVYYIGQDDEVYYLVLEFVCYFLG